MVIVRMAFWLSNLAGTGDKSLMAALLSRYIVAAAALTGIILGFLVPDIGVLLRPYVAYLLMLVMFSTILTIKTKEVLESSRNLKSLIFPLLMIFVFTPALALTGKELFSPAVFTGVILALCAPAGLATAFFVRVFKGVTAYSLVITIITNLISVVTIPFTIFLVVGTAVGIDVSWMFLNLMQIILVPAIFAVLVQRIVKIDLNRLSGSTSKLNSAIFLLVIWGSIAGRTTYTQNNPAQFLALTIYILACLAVAFIVTYAIAAKYGQNLAITLGIAASLRNGTLPLVIATVAFGSETMSPLVANLIAQNLILVFLGICLKEREHL